MVIGTVCGISDGISGFLGNCAVEDSRRSEDNWWQEWEEVRPRVLGALCDALSGALRRCDETQLTKMPRMAAFAKLMAAASPSLGWEKGEFERAYAANRANTSETAFEADLLQSPFVTG